MEDFCDYDPADNARKSYETALREIRLDRIRRGLSHPRRHVPIEVEAWRQGLIARSLIGLSLAACLGVVAILAVVASETPPVGTYRAANAGGE